MYFYYVHNKTRKTYCIIETKEILCVGQTVLVKFDNKEISQMCECEILKIIKCLES